jgi:hypothetical protein
MERSALGFLGILAVAAGARIALALLYPSALGDGQIYETVARNIWVNGCVSLSSPESGDCAPHWGGNQLPGFPAFVALTWAMTAGWSSAPLVAQALLSALAIGRLMSGLRALEIEERYVLACGALLALSPVTLPFSRLLWTEALAIAATTWIFAEFVRAEARGRLALMPLAAALTAAFFIRLDGALLAIPFGIMALRLHAWREGLLRCLAVGLIVLSAYGLWSARSHLQGLGWAPKLIADLDGGTPRGFLRWTQSWMTNQYQLEAVNWPAIQQQYDAIVVPSEAYRSADEKRVVEELLVRLHSSIGQPMPRAIADAFENIAERRIATAPFDYWVLVPAKRALWLWFNPFTALGWPGKIDPASKHNIVGAISEGAIIAALETAMGDAPQLILRVGGFGYRAALALAALAIGVVLWRKTPLVGRGVMIAALAFAAVRTAVFVFFGGVETRYIVEALPPLELALVLAWASARQRP